MRKNEGESVDKAQAGFLSAVDIKLTSTLKNINRYRRNDPLKVSVVPEDTTEALWLHFYCGNQSQSLRFPKPYTDVYGNYVIGDRVKRAVGSWFPVPEGQDAATLFESGKEKSYWEMMVWLLTGRIEKVFTHLSKRPQLVRLINSFIEDKSPLAFRSFQEMVDTLINRLPLTGTPMQTWAMSNRVVFIDPIFDSLTPNQALDYQKKLNESFFPWTSIGLSDSGMCNNNLLKQDLRRFTPFGIKHHNPMRNLYQTLGMKGDEEPLVVTESMAKLTKKQGVVRRGFNWMTAFIDVPANFEDQLIVDNRHLDKFTIESRRFMCFGEIKVEPGQQIGEGAVLSLEPNGKPLSFWVRSDQAVVTDVEKDSTFFNGQQREVTWVYVETKHAFKEGIKLTNRHGNKGVVTFADCGFMVDESKGINLPIDIIVSARTIGKRKNFGQVLETLLNLSNEGKEMIIPDNSGISLKALKNNLKIKGYAEDGTSPVYTDWFTGRAMCGPCFWGVIKNPENQLWTRAEVLATDNRGRRNAGLKLSHIEFKGLTTIFGPESPIIDEILSYQQGMEDVVDLVNILEVMRGSNFDYPVLEWEAIKPLKQQGGYFHGRGEIRGTIVDEDLVPDGFMLQLPEPVCIFTPDDERKAIQINWLKNGDMAVSALPDGLNVFVDKLYVPRASLRGNWQHPTGVWGLSDIGGYLNNIVLGCHASREGTKESKQQLLWAIQRYFRFVANRLSTKRGEISTYALAVRYPHSVKATATLSKGGLDPNWVEIHQEMAEDLGVQTGDLVIAERFPCLGFKSLRIQKVKVTDDPQCRFVIRVSGNSLVSQNLDFDGDVLFLMSFKTEAANQALAQEFDNPHALRMQYIEEANAAKVPTISTANLDSINFQSFEPLTASKQSEIVGMLTGVKRGTGVIVALAYNLMRIIEGNVGLENKEINLAMEVIMDIVANSVFGQKHNGVSLEERCKEAICTANLEEMLDMGFPESGSRRLCSIIRELAESLGVQDLEKHYRSHLTKGHSNIINKIVRERHPFYFATRSSLDGPRLLRRLEGPTTDLAAHLWKRSLSAVVNKETTNVNTNMPGMQGHTN